MPSPLLLYISVYELFSGILHPPPFPSFPSCHTASAFVPSSLACAFVKLPSLITVLLLRAVLNPGHARVEAEAMAGQRCMGR